MAPSFHSGHNMFDEYGLPALPDEEWRHFDLTNHPYHQVSNKGRVRILPREVTYAAVIRNTHARKTYQAKIISPSWCKKHKRYTFTATKTSGGRKSWTLARAMAIGFNIPRGPFDTVNVTFIDGDGRNCVPENLRFAPAYRQQPRLEYLSSKLSLGDRR